jgi:hypothetical protein
MKPQRGGASYRLKNYFSAHLFFNFVQKPRVTVKTRGDRYQRSAEQDIIQFSEYVADLYVSLE